MFFRMGGYKKTNMLEYWIEIANIDIGRMQLTIQPTIFDQVADLSCLSIKCQSCRIKPTL